MTVKLRKVGTSKVLTVPAYLKTTAKEYYVLTTSDGAIVYIPAGNNIDIENFVKQHNIEFPLYNI